MNRDPVTELAESWQRELPDLDVAPMATVAHVNRMSILLNRRVESALAEEDSSLAEFDVLSALRRQGPPYLSKPSELSRRLMLSASGMTHRIDLLEAAGLVERRFDPTNKRIMPVSLTESGVKRAEALVRLVVAVESEVLDHLSATLRSSLERASVAVIDALT